MSETSGRAIAHCVALQELRAAAAAMVKRWDEVLPSIQEAESMAYVHGWRYSGPEGGLKAQMDALRAALSTNASAVD